MTNSKSQPWFWGKTVNGQPGISALQHMLNVGRVAAILSHHRSWLDSPELSALAALHDLGKISPGFQRKCPAWLEANNLAEVDCRWAWDTLQSDHGQATQQALSTLLRQDVPGLNRRLAQRISRLLGMHHGQFRAGPGPISEAHSGIDWELARKQTFETVCAAFAADLSKLKNLTLDEDEAALTWLAGLTSVADWIGSDERVFPASAGGRQPDGQVIAQYVAALGLSLPPLRAGLSWQDLFGEENSVFKPNDMQLRAWDVITQPGVYVVEAPTGCGKTEAALGATYRLLLSGQACGLYFALPTQTTSNKLKERLGTFVRRITGQDNAQLIHSAAWMISKPMQESSERAARDWFSSSKRALLAPFGLGTVDQALLGVVAAKHFFVRQYALAGKVVVLDEVHSYDVFTGTLIDRLIRTLEALGCTVIVLSATLTGARRNKLVGGSATTLSYPVITGRRGARLLTPATAKPPASRTIELSHANTLEARQAAVNLAAGGGCVVWIANTVPEAQEQYRELHRLAKGRFLTGLLHARFPFWRREALEAQWLQRLGKRGDRLPSVLVSTQIVEQSVDVDADLLITELAPIDMFLQRLGRLWRHDNRRPIGSRPRVILLAERNSLSDFRQMSAVKIKHSLGKKAYVYDPFVLLRSLETLHGRTTICTPNDVRHLIEDAYAERSELPEWAKLYRQLRDKAEDHEQLAKRNSTLWQLLLDDAEHSVQTRLTEVEQIALLLCTERRISGGEIQLKLLDGTAVTLLYGQKQTGGRQPGWLALARAVHRNLVNVPRHWFQESQSSADATGPLPEYVLQPHGLGLVRDGLVVPEGLTVLKALKQRKRICWDENLGIYESP